MADDRIGATAAGLLELARGEGIVERFDAEFSRVAQAFESSPDLGATLGDLRVPTDRRQAIISDLLGGRAADLTVAAVNLLVATDRIGDIAEIAADLSRQTAAAAGKELAVVRSAIDLDDATVARLAAALTKVTGRQVDVKVVVDPSVLGGIVATVGDTVIDGTVRSRLAQLRAAVSTR